MRLENGSRHDGAQSWMTLNISDGLSRRHEGSRTTVNSDCQMCTTMNIARSSAHKNVRRMSQGKLAKVQVCPCLPLYPLGFQCPDTILECDRQPDRSSASSSSSDGVMSHRFKLAFKMSLYRFRSRCNSLQNLAIGKSEKQF